MSRRSNFFIFQVIGMVLIFCLERAGGIPFLSLAGSWFLIEGRSSLLTKVITWMVLSIILAVLYHLSFVMSLLIMMMLVQLMKYAVIIKKESLRLLLGVLILGLGVAWLSRIDVVPITLILSLLSLIGVLVLSRRVVFQEHQTLDLQYSPKNWLQWKIK